MLQMIFKKIFIVLGIDFSEALSYIHSKLPIRLSMTIAKCKILSFVHDIFL